MYRIEVVNRTINVIRQPRIVNVYAKAKRGLVGPQGPKGDTGDPASNLVQSVNGKQGVVVLTSNDVGADQLGSAASAQASSKTYTDQEVSSLESELAVVAKTGSYNDLIGKPVIPSISGLATEEYVDNRDSVMLQDAKDYTDSEIANIPASPVQSVNGETGVVVLSKEDIGLGNVDNTSDLSKPISNATQSSLNNKIEIGGDIGGTITIPVLRNVYRVFNVRDYGATGDGTTDDTSAIQSAIDTATVGGTVYAPPGDYLINGTINLKSSIRLIGAGMDNGGTLVSTTFRRASTTGNPVFRVNGTPPAADQPLSTAPVKRVLMSDFTIRASGSDNLLQCFYTNRNKFERIRFIGTTGNAVHGVEFWDTPFDFCQFDFTGSNTNPSVLLQNSASTTPSALGYSNDNINRITFRTCTWESFNSRCIHLDGNSNGSTHLMNNITIEDCKMETSTLQVPMISSTASVTSVYLHETYLAGNDGSGAIDIIDWKGSSLSIDKCRFYQGTTGTVRSAIHMSGHAGPNIITSVTCNWSGFAPTSGGAVWIQTPASPSRDAIANIRVDVGKRVIDETNTSAFRVDPRIYVEADQTPELILEQTGTNPKKLTFGITPSGNISIQPNNGALWTVKRADGTNFSIFDMLNGRLGVGTNAAAVSPTSSLHVAGSITTKTDNLSANTTLTIDHSRVLVDATAANRTITLPTAVGIAGRSYTVLKSDSSSNTVTVATTSSQTINGVTTNVLATQYKYVEVVSNGSNWVIIANN